MDMEPSQLYNLVAIRDLLDKTPDAAASDRKFGKLFALWNNVQVGVRANIV